MGEISFQWCSFDSTVAKIIDWGTQGSVGHVDLILPGNTGLLGAQHEDGLGGKPAGVQIRPMDYGDTCGMLLRKRATITVSDQTAALSYAWAQSMIGTPYDVKAIEGIALNEDWSVPGHMICSGFCTGVLTQPALPVIRHQLPRPWRIITPEQHMLMVAVLAEIKDV